MRLLQVLGLLLALISFILALVVFDLPNDNIHRNLGIAVIAIGLFQVRSG